MIEKLQQIEDKLLLSLLQKPNEWKTLMIDYHPPIVERCWAQIGNYRILLHFIHKCERKDALFHPHPWPSAMHVLEGKYEMGLGQNAGLVEPEKMCTIVLDNGGAYYDMTHVDGWHYVRPVDGVCATVMLIGKPWEREEIKSNEPLKPMDMNRKFMMLEWFTNWFTAKIQSKRIVENAKIKKGDWVQIDETIITQYDKKGLEGFFGKMGFVIGIDKNFVDIRFDGVRTQVHSKNLIMLDASTKPKNIEAEKSKLDDMDPANWEDD